MTALSGAISDGFSTMVQPAAKAGTTLQAIWFIGQFHGVMKPHTPTGSLAMSVVPRRLSNEKSLRIAIIWFRWARPVAAWARLDSHAGAPISLVMVCAS